MTARKRDRCSVCLAEFLVKADGTIRYHGPHPKPCPGGGKPPAVMHDPLGPDGWARSLIAAHSSAEPTPGGTP